MRMIPKSPIEACNRLALAAVASCCVAWAPAVAQDAAEWEVVGRQGIIQIVIVPQAQAGDRDAYTQQVKRLCAAGQTCFVNFFTNSTGAPVSLPLPDAVANEATAIYRHSVKQGGELFRWSCRLGKNPTDCF